MKKWLQLRAVLVLLGALTIQLIMWPIYCCAGSPMRDIAASSKSQPEIISSNNDYANDSYETMILINNFTSNITFLPQDYMKIINLSNSNDVSDKYSNVDRNMEKKMIKNDDMKSHVSSIYEIFYTSNNNDNKKYYDTNSMKTRVLMRTDRSAYLNSSNSKANNFNGTKRVKGNNKLRSSLDRNERSANLSHITGSARKIQLYIKNRFLQLLPDGTVNGTTDDLSDYTILQRTTYKVGQIKIQGVATCLFLCMNNCGITYGSIEFTDDCIFNESMEEHHYNTYSSTYNSNAKRTFYLGLNRHGQPRKIQISPTRQLGKLSTYTKSLTQTVAHERVDQLITRIYGANHLKHGLKQLCDTGKVLQNIKTKGVKNKSKCNNSMKTNNNNKKKKKKKRKCREDEHQEEDRCIKVNVQQNASDNSTSIVSNNYSNSSNIGNQTKNNNSNKKKSPLVNNQQKKCGLNNEDCSNNNNNRKNMKKKTTKKNGNHTKNIVQNNGKQQKTKKKITKTATTTLKPEEEYIDHDIVDSSLASEEDEDYDEAANTSSLTGDAVNFIDEHDHDQDEYSL